MSATEHVAAEEPDPEPGRSAVTGVGRLSRGARRVLRTKLLLLRQRRRERDDAEAAEERTGAAAEETALEYETEKHTRDPNETRPGRFPVATTIAGGAALLETLPAYWTAEALNRSPRETVVMTFLFVALLTIVSSMLSLFTHLEWRLSRVMTLVVGTVGVAIATGLRYDFVRVVNGDSAGRAALEAGVLALFSVVLVWLGFVVLVRCEPWKLFRLRVASETAEAVAIACAAALEGVEVEYALAGEALQHAYINRDGESEELVADVAKELQEVAAEKARRLSVVPGGAEGAA
jgi:branched-subunit amino acid transport protein